MTHDNKQATALAYSGTGAPIVSAKGTASIAEEIIMRAQEAGVHIHQDKHLSEFLQKIELGEEIPEEVYRLIAEILSFVYLLEGKDPRD